eukprot:GCRY01008416.1.p1 GENE.GCRY01008416.1~~GCRY01008416.1.p1  ORF type:complete len:175 (+),score=36.28 GCRY01008416.1:2-526(+)
MVWKTNFDQADEDDVGLGLTKTTRRPASSGHTHPASKRTQPRPATSAGRTAGSSHTSVNKTDEVVLNDPELLRAATHPPQRSQPQAMTAAFEASGSTAPGPVPPGTEELSTTMARMVEQMELMSSTLSILENRLAIQESKSAHLETLNLKLIAALEHLGPKTVLAENKSALDTE